MQTNNSKSSTYSLSISKAVLQPTGFVLHWVRPTGGGLPSEGLRGTFNPWTNWSYNMLGFYSPLYALMASKARFIEKCRPNMKLAELLLVQILYNKLVERVLSMEEGEEILPLTVIGEGKVD